MATERQIEANRLNAEKSTGPTSPEGKACCSKNALKSGLYAQCLVTGREQSEDFHILQAEYYCRHQPITPEECVLVDTLIRNEWLLRRLTRIETELWDRATDQAIEQDNFDENYSFAPLLPKLENSLARLQTRMNACDRSFRTALHDLTKLQSTRQPIATEPTSPEIGFVPPSREVASPEGAPVAPAARRRDVGQASRPAEFGFVPPNSASTCAGPASSTPLLRAAKRRYSFTPPQTVGQASRPAEFGVVPSNSASTCPGDPASSTPLLRGAKRRYSFTPPPFGFVPSKAAGDTLPPAPEFCNPVTSASPMGDRIDA